MVTMSMTAIVRDCVLSRTYEFQGKFRVMSNSPAQGSTLKSLFSAKGWTRVWVGALISTLVCVLAALSVDLVNASAMSDEARLRSILTDIFLPIVLAGPLSFYFLKKLRELAISNSNLQVTLNAMGQGLSGFDAGYRLSIWNARYAELFGLDLGDVGPGRPFLDLLELQRSNGDFEGSAQALQDTIVRENANGVPFINVTARANGVVVRTVHMPAPEGGVDRDARGRHSAARAAGIARASERAFCRRP